MIVTDPKTLTELDKAQEFIENLQVRLMQCEMHLEDLARCSEIVEITKQFHLLSSFTAAANEYLKDKLEMPEEEPAKLKINVYTDDDSVLSKSS